MSNLTPDRRVPGDWFPDPVPANVAVGAGVYIESACSFKRMKSRRPDAVTLGDHSSVYAATQFALAEYARCIIGDYTMLNGALIMAEELITVGRHCLISWNVCIADSDFHPMSILQRRRDTIALSPGGDKTNRPFVPCRPVVIEDDVWIGFNAVILKGVRVGRGAVIGAGSVVTKDVPPMAVVVGNPGRVIRILPDDAGEPERAAAMGVQ